MIITIILSMFIGAVISSIVLFLIFNNNRKLSVYKDLSKLIDTYSTINNNYYGDLNKEEIIDEAINAMIDSVGDSYTTYTNTKETESFMQEVEGVYEGIGCSVATTLEGLNIVVDIFENSPAQKAGLELNDIILEVDGQNYEEKTSVEISQYIKTNKNKKITMKILRGEEEKEIIITRGKIEIPVVSSEVIEQDSHKIGYIYISMFTSVSASQFETHLKKLEEQNIEGLVIDVRNNGGGYLSEVEEIASLFLKKGTTIYQLQNEDKTEMIKDTTKEKRIYPIAVIQNEESASASEILASAIKENYKGYVVGTNSYGKGTVQQTKTLNDGSMIKYTAQNWLTPEGNWINETGVEPTDYLEYEYSEELDNQLDLSIDLILEELN